MVGCGGFGPANTGAAIMVRAAASEPAILALTVTFLEFIGIFLYRPYWTRDHAEQNTAPPSACRTIQRAEGSDTDATCLALFKLPPTRSRSREQDAPSTIARNFPTLLRLHRIGRLPIVTRRRLEVLQAPLEHDAGGLIRSPCIQNLLEEVCRACEIAGGDRLQDHAHTAPPSPEAQFRVRRCRAIRRSRSRLSVHTPSAGPVRAPGCARRHDGEFPPR